jgi:hypothetical protein
VIGSNRRRAASLRFDIVTSQKLPVGRDDETLHAQETGSELLVATNWPQTHLAAESMLKR